MSTPPLKPTPPLESTPPLRPTLSLKSTPSLKSIPPIPTGALLAVWLVINKTAYSWAYRSNDQPLLDELEFLKGVDLDKVQTFKIMPWDKIKG